MKKKKETYNRQSCTQCKYGLSVWSTKYVFCPKCGTKNIGPDYDINNPGNFSGLSIIALNIDIIE